MDEITRLTDHMNALVAKGDVPGIMEILTDDVVFLPPNDTPKVGKAEYLRWVSAFQDRFRVKATTVSREDQVAGDWAYEWGLLHETFTPKDGSAPFDFDGKFLRVFHKQPDGSSGKIATTCEQQLAPM